MPNTPKTQQLGAEMYSITQPRSARLQCVTILTWHKAVFNLGVFEGAAPPELSGEPVESNHVPLGDITSWLLKVNLQTAKVSRGVTRNL